MNPLDWKREVMLTAVGLALLWFGLHEVAMITEAYGAVCEITGPNTRCTGISEYTAMLGLITGIAAVCLPITLHFWWNASQRSAHGR
jgi:hypothetical protein